MTTAGHNNPPDDKPVRCFQRYTHDARALHAASFRLGDRKRTSVGEFYWTVPSIPDVAFPTRKHATQAVIDRDRNA